MPLSADDLTKLWRATLGNDGAAQGWPTLSGGATYRGDGDSTPPLVQATLSGQQTVGGGTLSGGATVGVAGGGATSGVSTSKIGIGGFQLKEEIGRGGMGVVWRARQESLARDIAVKLIRPEAANERTRQGFVAEALVNGVLDHPNIVPVHEMGTTAGGEVFLAMKLVGGASWDRLLHPRDDAERARATTYDRDKHLGVLDAVANAIAFAHSKGIVHRDLKPENVMVGAYGEVLVMDWGIAVDIRTKPDPADSRAVHKSAIRSPAGTPNYMAPELAEGRGDDIGPWTDVYLLGGILHELLTGRPPHRGNSLMALLLAASTSTPPAFDAQVPTGLADICRRALSRDHHARYQDVPAFQAALAEYRKHRESENVASAAEAALRRTTGRDATKLGGAERSALYGDFAEAVAGYRQALALWDGNDSARRGERDARLAYAGAARTAGDLGLAEAQAAALPTDDREADALRSAITSDRVVADRAVRAARRNRGLLLGAAGLIVAGSLAGFFLVEQERARTVEQRDKAVTAEGRAVEQEQRALSALGTALVDQGTLLSAQGQNLAALDVLWRAVETVPADGANQRLRQDAWRFWRLVALGAMGAVGDIRLPPPKSLDPATPSTLMALNPGPGGQVATVWHLGWRAAPSGNQSVLLLRIERPGSEQPAREHELADIDYVHGLLWLDQAIVLAVTWRAEKHDAQPIIGLDPATLALRWSAPGIGQPEACDADTFLVRSYAGWMRCDASDGRVLSWIDSNHMGGVSYDPWPTWYSPAGWMAVGELHTKGQPPRTLALYRAPRHVNRDPDDPKEPLTVPHVLPLSFAPGKPYARITPPSADDLISQVVISGDGSRLAVLTDGANVNRLLLFNADDGTLAQRLDEQVPDGMRIAGISPTGDAVWLSAEDGLTRLYANGSQGLAKPQTVLARADGWSAVALDGDGRALLTRADHAVRVQRLGDPQPVREQRAPAGHRFGGVSLDGRALLFVDDAAVRLIDTTSGEELGRIAPPAHVPLAERALLTPEVEALADPAPVTPDELVAYLRGVDLRVSLAADRRSALVYSATGVAWGRFLLPDGTPHQAEREPPTATTGTEGRMQVNLHVVGGLMAIRSEVINPFIEGGTNDRFDAHELLLSGDAGQTFVTIGSAFTSAAGARRAPVALLGGDDGASLWDVRSGRLLRHLGSGSGAAVALDADALLAATRSGNRLHLWDVASGRRLASTTMPSSGQTSDWHLDDGGRRLRWIADGAIQELVLLDERQPPNHMPAVLPPPTEVARAWPRPAPFTADLTQLAAQLAAAQQQGAPGSAIRRAAAMGIAAVPPRRRLTVIGLPELNAVLRKSAPAPTMAPGAQPPVPALLGDEPVKQVNGVWTTTQYGGRVPWRYVPPGEYRNAGADATVRLTVGFWAMGDMLRPDRLDYNMQLFLGGCGLNGTTAEANGMLSISPEVAMRLADPLLPLRLPTVAESIAMVQLFDVPTSNHHWTADAWPAARHTAIDPWGAWDRLALGEIRDGVLPLLDAVPAPDAMVGIGSVWHSKPTATIQRTLQISAGGFASPALLVAPAW